VGDLPGNGTVTQDPEHRLRIKASELELLREALAKMLYQDLIAFVKRYEDQLRERERADWDRQWEIRKEVQAQAGEELARIEREYLLLYRLVRRGTGRPWESRFDPLDRWFRDKASKLMAPFVRSKDNGTDVEDPQQRYHKES